MFDIDYCAALTDLLAACQRHPELRVTTATLAPPEPPGPLPHPEWIPESVQALAATTNGFELRWEPANPGTNVPTLAPVKGVVQLLPLAETYGSWEGVLDFKFFTEPDEQWRKSFKIMDMVEGAEALIGLYHDEHRDPQLYYCNREDPPSPLGIDLPGYLALLLHTLGGVGWQYALLDFQEVDPGVPVTLAELPEVQQFAQQLQRVLPTYDPQPLIDCYYRVRLPGPGSASSNC